MNRILRYTLLTVFFGLSMAGFAQKTISMETLLKEMVDRNERAKLPDPAFSCKQFSSYDRATVAKGEKGWFANRDHSNFIRTENNNGRRELVMMEAEGPGAIVRFWMTIGSRTGQYGVMRIYVDDYSKPVIEGSAFEILSGTKVTSPPLAAGVSELTPLGNRGHNLYLPIPYSKRCKVTYESEIVHLLESDSGTENVYYNINYRTYDPSVNVVSYSAQEMKKNKSLVEKIQRQLKNKERGTEKMKLTQLPLNTSLKPGESKSFTINGMYAIQQLSMEVRADNQHQALRSTVLEIAFDSEKKVWSPVGDFYGTGYMPLYSSTWYTQVEKTGLMSAFWVMPFEKTCVITLHNLGEQEVHVEQAFAGYSPWKWDNRSMYFGAAWRQYTHVSGSPDASEVARDLNFASLRGKGVYVGDGVALFNTAYFWWGEGDEKVFVDGEEFPSHIGTGTEDYYGYAWSRSAVFTDHPFIAQPMGEGSGKPDYSVNTRYRGLDGIPFTRSIVFDMELWHSAPKAKINYAPIAYWYMLPGGKSLIVDDVDGAKEPVTMRRSDIYSNRIQFFIEGENLIPATQAWITYQSNISGLWSDGMQLFLRNISKGDKVDFEFTCPCAGQFDFSGIFTTGPEYGSFNLYVNGQQVASNLDLYSPEVQVITHKSGKVNLKSGINAFTVELTAYPKDLEKGCFGVDKLIFGN